jgi:hypothetical protein
MDFRTLLARSSQFRALIAAHRPMIGDNAELYWSQRVPRIEWNVCSERGCEELVPHGFRCVRHQREGGRLPPWRWVNNELYKLVATRFDHGGEGRGQTYAPYARWLVEQKEGRFPAGYDVVGWGMNPFFLEAGVLFSMSHIARDLVRRGKLSVELALQYDAATRDLFTPCGGRPRSVALIGLTDICRATGLRPGSVRSALSRGEFEMEDAESVLSYVVHRARTPRQATEGEKDVAAL